MSAHQWQVKDKGGTTIGRMFHGKATAGSGREACGKGQAQAQALFAGLGGKKGFEQMLACFGIDAVAIVTHQQAVFAIAALAFQP